MLNFHRDKKSQARTGERWENPSDHLQDSNVVVGGIGNPAR